MKQLTEQDIAQLSALLDDTLPAAEADALRQRLQHDAALYDVFVDLTLTRDAMRALPVAQPPRSLRIDPARLTKARGWRWWLVMPPAGQLIPNMAVALSLCVCILVGQQAIGAGSASDILKGIAEVEMMAPNAVEAPANSEMAADVSEPASQRADDSVSGVSDPTVQLVAPDQSVVVWWWAATVAAACATLATVVWAWRVAVRRRITQKR